MLERVAASAPGRIYDAVTKKGQLEHLPTLERELDDLVVVYAEDKRLSMGPAKLNRLDGPSVPNRALAQRWGFEVVYKVSNETTSLRHSKHDNSGCLPVQRALSPLAIGSLCEQ